MLNKTCVLKSIKQNTKSIQNQYMKDIIIQTFNKKHTTQNYYD